MSSIWLCNPELNQKIRLDNCDIIQNSLKGLCLINVHVFFLDGKIATNQFKEQQSI